MHMGGKHQCLSRQLQDAVQAFPVRAGQFHARAEMAVEGGQQVAAEQAVVPQQTETLLNMTGCVEQLNRC